MDTDKKVLHEDLTRDIIGAAFDVHNALGCGLLEKVYENALAHELGLREHVVTPQEEFTITYKGKDVGAVHRAQVLNYLRISGIRVGLLLNFAKPKLKFERFVV